MTNANTAEAYAETFRAIGLAHEYFRAWENAGGTPSLADYAKKEPKLMREFVRLANNHRKFAEFLTKLPSFHVCTMKTDKPTRRYFVAGMTRYSEFDGKEVRFAGFNRAFEQALLSENSLSADIAYMGTFELNRHAEYKEVKEYVGGHSSLGAIFQMLLAQGLGSTGPLVAENFCSNIFLTTIGRQPVVLDIVWNSNGWYIEAETHEISNRTFTKGTRFFRPLNS